MVSTIQTLSMCLPTVKDATTTSGESIEETLSLFIYKRCYVIQAFLGSNPNGS
jgi:hypothetical protein